MIPEDVLQFWFSGDLTSHREVWFQRDPMFDTHCTRFAEAHAAATGGALDGWAETPEGALALIILLDQFPRNLYRDQPEAFAADAKARKQARTAVARGFDQRVPPAARLFFYLPFEHSEDLSDQEEAVRLFASLGDAKISEYALRHRAVIRRFGRFPHRNAALGRIGTAEEIAHLAEHESGF